MSDDAASGDDPPERPSQDLVLVGGPSAHGAGADVLRIRDGRIETGELRALKEGQPVIGELVKLSSRPEHERLFDVEVLARGAQPKSDTPALPPRKGPAKVSTDAYRSGWDAIFGKPRDDQPN